MIPTNSIRDQLRATDESTQLTGLKRLKNTIIGHTDQKELLCTDDVINPLLSLLANGPLSVSLQASIVLGSFAHGSESTVQKLLRYPVIQTVITTINSVVCPDVGTNEVLSPSPELISSCLRILVTILQAQPAVGVIAQYPEIIDILTILLSGDDCPSDIVLQTCKLIPLLSPRKTASLTRLPSLAPYLLKRISNHMAQGGHRTQLVSRNSPLEAALSAVSQILTEKQARSVLELTASNVISINSKAPAFSESSNDFLLGLVHLTRADDIGIRLTAVELLSKLQNYASSPVQRDIIARNLLPTLVPMFDLLGTDPRVSLTLSYICRDNEKHASLAVEIGLVKKIITVLKAKDIASWKDREIIENNLYALAGIGIHRDSLRMEIVEAGALTYITNIISLKPAAESSSADISSIRKVKISACHVLRALSRSVALIRTSLASTDIVDGIVDLYTESEPSPELNDGIMSDESSFEVIEREQQREDQLEVRTAVMAAICNLILEFSPVQKTIFEKGALDLIIDGAHSDYASLRLNSIWALKHAIFEANRDTKSMALSKLEPSYLLRLCNDSIIEIQEQSLDFIRNFLCRNYQGVDYIFESIGKETLFELIEDKIDLHEQFPQVLTPAIYILVHIAAGTDEHRDIVAEQESVLSKLIPLMTHPLADVRTAIVWLIINLTWLEEPDNSPRREVCKIRAERLARLGFKDMLDKLSQDPTLDVRERTKTALYQFDELFGRGSSNYVVS
ncbi:glucose-induced degradation complex subunit VID28 [Sugiyamaella lignohabitans]|uniref:Glucose-induced degradation complex subunit VID28 n=1 Tax=Sugiyamaella lignohabitans TaxID=796027 RepID=A0A161HFQ9_9ASCO|nr:glucose-induced degradation complex subunit VID28 [Sugiyamaella lignohabitans]ANB14430.1 glucose-induced degradation complex subunit VID28 [Sugiyamaella lignohabitans]